MSRWIRKCQELTLENGNLKAHNENLEKEIYHQRRLAKVLLFYVAEKIPTDEFIELISKAYELDEESKVTPEARES
jgi:hypothetical protein